MLLRVLWHTLSLLFLMLIAGVRMGAPFWRLNAEQMQFTLLMAAGYLASAVLLELQSAGSVVRRAIQVAATSLSIFGLVFLALLVRDSEYSRVVLLLTFAAAMALLAAGFCMQRFQKLLLVGVAAGVCGLAALTMGTGFVLRPTLPPASETIEIQTGLYNLKATFHRHYIPRSSAFYAGGALAALGDGYLLANSDADVYWLDTANAHQGGELGARRLPHRVPLNRGAFAATSGEGDFTQWFRVLDVLADETGDRVRVFASYHFWHEAEQCFTVRVSQIAGEREELLSASAPAEWTTMYETAPCLPLIESSWPFRGMEGGGRMLLFDDDSLLLTVGDQGFNGIDFPTDYVQDPAASYGKTLVVDLAAGSAEVFSIGHRNPQGLWADSPQSVWLTEHGPRGGDELNRIRPATHYGWPVVTYGTDYGSFVWPLSTQQGAHLGFEEPTFAWVPSIGISNLIRVRGDSFPAWSGDFLVAGLRGEAIFRLRLHEGQVVLVEPIAIGERVRDLAEDDAGRIVLWTDSHSVVVLEPAIASAVSMCLGCHPTHEKAPHGIGPNLFGLFDRTIGSAPGFAYTNAIRQIEGEWTEAKLDAFLSDPQGFAPGTSMMIKETLDAQARAEIIEHFNGLR